MESKETNKRVTIARLDAKMDQVLEYIAEQKQGKKETDGKIDNLSSRVNTLEVKHDTCPARSNYMSDKTTTRSWIQWLPSVVAVVVSLVSLVLAFGRA